MPLGNTDTSKIFLNISFGKLRQKVTESTSGAVKRENKLGETVWEKVYGWVSGKITGIYYKEHSEYGNSYEITIHDGKEIFSISLNEDSKYCKDFLSKIPAVELDGVVTLAPYDFKPADKEKNIKGLTIKQDGEKIENYFIQKDGDNRKFLYGFPEQKGELSKTQWKIYSIKVQEFLNEYTKENILPKLINSQSTFVSDNVPDVIVEKEDDDLPF